MKPCQATYQDGTPCRNNARKGSDYCGIPSHCGDDESGLTDKQQRFVEEYCVDYNMTQAAIRAGYSENSAGDIGKENMGKTLIREAVSRRMAELAMPPEEAVKRLGDWARGSIEVFLKMDPQTGTYMLDLSSPEAKKNLHLIKEIKQNDIIQKKKHKRVEDGKTIEVEVPEVVGRSYEIKLHDAKDAVDKILKVNGKYIDNVNLSVGPAPWDPENGDPVDYVKQKISG